MTRKRPQSFLKRLLPHAGDDAFAAARKQMALIALIIGGAWLLALAHLGVLARPFFVASALALALFYIRRSPWLYLTAVLWFWTISPFARRLLDYYGGFQAANIVLLTPNLVTLLMLGRILASRTLWKRPEAASGMLLLGPVFYGLAVSFAKGDIFAGAVASLDWLIPLLFYFYLIDLSPRIDELEAPFRAFIPWNMLAVAVYGLYALYYPTSWDAVWIAGAFGKRPDQMPPFSLLNSTGACAVWLGALILFSLNFRTRMSALLMAPAILMLALTQVRMAAGAVALGLAAMALFGEWRMRRSLLIVFVAVAAAFAAIATFDPEATDALVARFSTVGDLQNDGSAKAREDLYRAAPVMLSDNPLGLGIGALGKGVRVGGGEGMDDFDFRNHRALRRLRLDRRDDLSRRNNRDHRAGLHRGAQIAVARGPDAGDRRADRPRLEFFHHEHRRAGRPHVACRRLCQRDRNQGADVESARRPAAEPVAGARRPA